MRRRRLGSDEWPIHLFPNPSTFKASRSGALLSSTPITSGRTTKPTPMDWLFVKIHEYTRSRHAGTWMDFSLRSTRTYRNCKPPMKTAPASPPRTESRKVQLHPNRPRGPRSGELWHNNWEDFSAQFLRDDSLKIIPVEEIPTINVKPGWKKGTVITFLEGRI